MKLLSFDWALLFQWMVATTVGWILGVMLFPGLSLLAAGVFICVFQAIILKGHIARPLRWVQASLAGWGFGYLLVVLLVPPGLEALQGLLLGLAIGTAQWLVLRGALHWAAWWIPFSVMAWVTGLTLLPGFFLTGTIAGALTGLALEILLRNPIEM